MKKVYEDHLYSSINKIHDLYVYIFMAVLILVSLILLMDLHVKLAIVFNHVFSPFPGCCLTWSTQSWYPGCASSSITWSPQHSDGVPCKSFRFKLSQATMGVMVAGYFVDAEKTSGNLYSIGLGSIFAQGV